MNALKSCITPALIAVTIGAGPSFSASPSAALRYNVLLDKEPELCGVLRDFYNRRGQAHETTSIGYVEEQFGNDLEGSGVEFLFPRRNWRPPQSSFGWLQVFGGLNIYRDGAARNVVLYDYTPSLSWGLRFATEVWILKPDATVGDLYRHKESDAEQIIDFQRGGSSVASQPKMSFYSIVELPPRKLLSGNLFPRTISTSAQRLLRYQNRIYLVARERTDGPLKEGVNILIYTVERSGAINNICYLEAQPLSR